MSSRSSLPLPPREEVKNSDEREREEEKEAPHFSSHFPLLLLAKKEDAKKTIPEKTWRGERPGYYFGRNEKNVLGYHLDEKKASDDFDDEVWRETWVRVALEKEKEKRENRARTMEEMRMRKKRRKEEEDPDDYKGGKKNKNENDEKQQKQLTKRERERLALERLKQKREEEADDAGVRRGGGGGDDWRRREGGGARGGFGRHNNRTGSGEFFDGKKRGWSGRR